MSTVAFGGTARLRYDVRLDGVLVTPQSITLTIRLPDGSTAGPFIPEQAGVGQYRHDHPAITAGRHVARWLTTGPATADEEPFDVAALWSEAGIISLTDAKNHLKIPLTDTTHDADISEWIRASAVIIEHHVGAALPTARTEQLRGGTRHLLLAHRPVLQIDSVTLPGGGTLPPAGYELDAEAGVLTRMAGAHESHWEHGHITISYTAGRREILAHIRLAARIIVAHQWETRRGRMGGARAAGADEVWDPRMGYAIPRRALELLGDIALGIA
ncbi:hypothetical protein ACFWYW_14595 [Nonomuraea sp. NPDC059023]|uniref:hypothetical protein n=1 Tax=unclassified Nonomuraea TaxID=2593643 RepID=UPI0036BFA630